MTLNMCICTFMCVLCSGVLNILEAGTWAHPKQTETKINQVQKLSKAKKEVLKY